MKQTIFILVMCLIPAMAMAGQENREAAAIKHYERVVGEIPEYSTTWPCEEYYEQCVERVWKLQEALDKIQETLDSIKLPDPT